jgi:predicted TIM-barrel fold metal-dependent hydrolase
MHSNSLGRRLALTSVAGAVIGGALGSPAAMAQSVPWSSGREPAVMKAPPNATDCHLHIYDDRFPVAPTATLRPGNALVADYRLLQKRIGTTRAVVVQPSTYGLDNRCTLDAIRQLGPTSRGIAVVDTRVSADELQAMHAAGVRGIRFNLIQAGATTVDMMEPLSKKVADLGWHLQLHMHGEQIVEVRDLLNRLATPIVFDHMGRIPQPAGTAHPAFGVIVDLLLKDRAWVKISGAYMDTKVGPPTYADTGALASAYLKAAPDRVVWGSDWPHPTEKNKPDDAVLFDLLPVWIPDEATRTRILVANPDKLYDFG